MADSAATETLSGWLYKRAPRANDADAHERRASGSSTSHATASASMRALNNLLVPSKQLYQRRWVAEDAECSLLVYYKTKPREGISAEALAREALGKIHLCQIHSVSVAPIDPKDAGPTEFEFHVCTELRVFSFCASSAEERDRWVGVVKRHALASGGMVAPEEERLSRGGSFREAEGRKHEIVPVDDAATQQRPPAARAERPSQTGLVKRMSLGPSARARGSRGSVPGMPEPGPPAQEVAAGLGPGRGEALALSRSHHRRCLGQKDAHEAAFVMGQLPLNCLWALAPKPWDELPLFQLLAHHCGHDTAPIQRLADAASFDFREPLVPGAPATAETIVDAGSAVENVFVVLEGSCTRAKPMFGKNVPVELAPLLPGDCFGVAELALFRMWITDVIAGPAGATLLRLPAALVGSYVEAVGSTLHTTFVAQAKSELVATLKTMPLFHDFEMTNLAHIVQLFEVRSFDPEITLVRQGDRAEEFFIIVTGNARVTKRYGSSDASSAREQAGGASADARADFPRGREHHIYTCHSGDWFGEIGLMRSQPRAASVTTVTPVVALTASPESFQKFLDLGGDQMRHKMEAAVKNQVRNVLTKIPLFADAADEFLELVCERVRFREASSGETIVEQGDESTELLVLASGSAIESLEYVELPGGERFSLGSIAGTSPPGGDDAGANAARPPDVAPAGVVVGHLGDSDFFAFASLLFSRTPEPYTITATSACVLLAIDANDMKEVMSHCAPMRTKIEARWAQVHQALRRDRDIASSLLFAGRLAADAAADAR